MKKHLLILLFLFGVFNTATAQETILMPTQVEWNEYVDERLKEIIQQIFAKSLTHDINAYITNNFSDTSNASLNKKQIQRCFTNTYVKRHPTFGSIEDPIYVTTEIPINKNELNGHLILSIKPTLTNNYVTKHLDGLGIQQTVKDSVSENFRNELWGDTTSTKDRILWFDFQDLENNLSESDLFFIQSIFDICTSCQSSLIEGALSPNKPEAIFANAILKKPELVPIKGKNSLLIKSLPNSLTYILKDIDSIQLYDKQRNVSKNKFDLFSIDYIKEKEVEVLDVKKSTSDEPVFKTIKVPVKTNFNTIDSLSFSSSGKIINLTFLVNSESYKLNFRNKKKKPILIFQLNSRAIKTNISLSKLTWWFEDYYKWTKRNKK